MTARIYKPAKTAMQSGQAKTSDWVLDYEPEEPRVVESLMGWTSSGDMKSQIRLRFATKEEAVAYAERHGIPYQVQEAKPAQRRGLSYADNFAFDRHGPDALDPLPAVQACCCSAACSRRGSRPQPRGAHHHALLEQRDEPLLRHRLAEQEALAEIAAHAHQRHRVGGLLEADADRERAEAVGEIDHGLADRRVDLVGAAADHERAVELHLGERHLLELHQRGIALAEVVDRQPDIVLGELLAQLVGERDLGDDLLLGDVDHQARPVVHLRAVRAHDVADRQLDQAFDRHVDRRSAG